MYNQPDKNGHFGSFGGIYIPEVLMSALQRIITEYLEAKKDLSFKEELKKISQDYSCRPTPLYLAENLTKKYGGAKIYFKREDLNHTGAHKFNNVLGQALLAKRMGFKRIIAETGAGQHGVATATLCAKLGIKCRIYMGEIDVQRQRPNVFWMEQLGAEVIAVKTGGALLTDAINACLQDWISDPDNTYYLLGTACGPHPYPLMVRDFQSVIGQEVKKQIQVKDGRLPNYLVACVGGGSNAIGLFYPFINNLDISLIGVEAGGEGVKGNKHASRFSSKNGKAGVVQGYNSFFLQDDDGQILETHSISAGLDYAGVGPEHSYLRESGRAKYVYATDQEVLKSFRETVREEGIIPALESSHAIAYGLKLAAKQTKEKIVVINISGRGDKDIFTIAEALKDKEWIKFLQTKKLNNINK